MLDIEEIAWELCLGDCVELMSDMEEDWIDCIVTDPPYGLEFMGKEFDKLGSGVKQQEWHRRWLEQAIRVLKPGGHILSFGGTRTYHRMVCAMEDAGFEIRDCLMWLYGSGFPKSLDVGKAIDKAVGAKREKVQPGNAPAYQRSIGNTRPWMDDPEHKIDGPEPVSEEAKYWDGWGTALKPAWEPIILGRKSFSGTVASNVLGYGTGALNIDGCRIPFRDEEDEKESKGKNQHGDFGSGPMTNQVFGEYKKDRDNYNPPGRWPTNVLIDEVVSTELASPSRFFYCAKAHKKERSVGGKVDNIHPTVKPIELMRYLVRLVCPLGGIVLDPFCGSGTTVLASLLEERTVVGIEKSEEYHQLAEARIEAFLE